MNRYKTYEATGAAPNGKIYAGDLNAIQDAVAALADFTQQIDLGTLRVGEAGLAITKYGTAEMQLAGSLRVTKVLRALEGLYAGSFTTTQRDAYASPPYGLVITNTTVNRLQWNAGTPSVPVWQDLGYVAPDTITALEIAAATITDTEVAAANKDGADATYSMRRLGTAAGRAAAGTHASQHAPGGADRVNTVQVATSLVGLQEYDGALAWVKAGNGRKLFTFDSTFGRWVSEQWMARPSEDTISHNTTVTTVYSLLFPIAHDYNEWYTAGARLQFRVLWSWWNGSASTGSLDFILYGGNSGAAVEGASSTIISAYGEGSLPATGTEIWNGDVAENSWRNLGSSLSTLDMIAGRFGLRSNASPDFTTTYLRNMHVLSRLVSD